jgi:hypothetical protein
VNLERTYHVCNGQIQPYPFQEPWRVLIHTFSSKLDARKRIGHGGLLDASFEVEPSDTGTQVEGLETDPSQGLLTGSVRRHPPDAR